ncbi:YhjD/YihY/BrkB family envelope integrity protein [Streptomyces sp. NPDC002870]|uniref:YhjD/YihY/BrkB family envelope integrity protein n=1 Tax=Streptomyces sp. NPDC002870 TaxID=3364666 RepID=UPI0036828BCB
MSCPARGHYVNADMPALCVPLHPEAGSLAAMTGRRRPHPKRGPIPRRGIPLAERRQAAARRLKESQAGGLWSRLSAVDFLGNSFQLASLALLCFFPFLIVVTAAAGRDAATTVAKWLGLNHEAAEAVASLFVEGEDSGTLTVTSACMLVVGAVAVAGTLQSWYQTLFDVPRRGWRDVVARLCWLAALLAYCAAQAVVGRALDAPLLQGLFGLAAATCFWLGAMYVLLSTAVPLRTLLPSAFVTAVCWTGLGVFSAYYFSAGIVANSEKYGPIGVVMIILSWLIAVGVVIHLGAVVGRLYLEHRSRPQR